MNVQTVQVQAHSPSPNSFKALLRWRHLPYVVLLILGTALLLLLAVLRYRSLETGYDLGIFNQVIWNLAHGRIWQTTLVFETKGYYDHFEPILVLLVPFYWLRPNADVLLILQAVALGLGSLPIYLYAWQRLRSLRIALLLAALYLIMPALHNANLYDFHEMSFLPVLLGFTLYGLLRGQRRVVFVFLGLALLVKEDVAVTAFAVGLYILLLKPTGFRRRDGLLIAAFAAVWMVLVLKVFYPALTRGMPYPFVGRRYAWLADTPEGALRALVTQPGQILSALLIPQKLLFLVRLLGPFLFLPLLGWPVVGLAAPILFYLMLSSYEPQWSIRSYYNPPLLPILFFALIQTFYRWRLTVNGRRLTQLALLGIVMATGITYYFEAPGPGSRRFQPASFRTTADDQAVYSLLAQIPDKASVSGPWHLLPQLSNRQTIYPSVARPQEPPQFLLRQNEPLLAGPPEFPFAAPNQWPPVYHDYAVIAEGGGHKLAQFQQSIPLTPLPALDPEPSPLAVVAYAWLGQPDPAATPALRPGDTARLLLAWKRTGTLDKSYVLFVHVLNTTDPADENVPRIAQNDHEPGNGLYPTTLWATWTSPPIVLDEQQFQVPAETPPGRYVVLAGAYDRVSGDRLEIGGTGKTILFVGYVEVK